MTNREGTITVTTTSDWHLGSDNPQFASYEVLEDALKETVHDTDALIVCGDNLNKSYNTSPKSSEYIFIEQLRSLFQIFVNANKQVFFTLGNHDEDERIAREISKKPYIIWLNGQVEKMQKNNNKLTITGFNGALQKSERRIVGEFRGDERREKIYELSQGLWLPKLQNALNYASDAKNLLIAMHVAPTVHTVSSQRQFQHLPDASPAFAEEITHFAMHNPSLQRLVVVHGHFHDKDNYFGANGHLSGDIEYINTERKFSSIETYNVATPLLLRETGTPLRRISFHG